MCSGSSPSGTGGRHWIRTGDLGLRARIEQPAIPAKSPRIPRHMTGAFSRRLVPAGLWFLTTVLRPSLPHGFLS